MNFLLTVEQKSEDRSLFQYDCSYISTDTSCWKCKTSRVQFYSGEFCESYDDKVRILVWICRCEIVDILTFQKSNLFLPLMLLEKNLIFALALKTYCKKWKSLWFMVEFTIWKQLNTIMANLVKLMWIKKISVWLYKCERCADLILFF